VNDNVRSNALVRASYLAASQIQTEGRIVLTPASLAGLLLEVAGTPRRALELARLLPPNDVESAARRYLVALVADVEASPDTERPVAVGE
jgi:hypothetical protein